MINKDHRLLQNLYMGEEENQRAMQSEALDVFSVMSALHKNTKNTEPEDFRAGSNIENNLIQLLHFTDKAGNKMTRPRSHSWLAEVHLSLLEVKNLKLLKTKRPKATQPTQGF